MRKMTTKGIIILVITIFLTPITIWNTNRELKSSTLDSNNIESIKNDTLTSLKMDTTIIRGVNEVGIGIEKAKRMFNNSRKIHKAILDYSVNDIRDLPENPYITFSKSYDTLFVNIVIRNRGDTDAFDVKIRTLLFDYPLGLVNFSAEVSQMTKYDKIGPSGITEHAIITTPYPLSHPYTTFQNPLPLYIFFKMNYKYNEKESNELVGIFQYKDGRVQSTTAPLYLKLSKDIKKAKRW